MRTRVVLYMVIVSAFLSASAYGQNIPPPSCCAPNFGPANPTYSNPNLNRGGLEGGGMIIQPSPRGPALYQDSAGNSAAIFQGPGNMSTYQGADRFGNLSSGEITGGTIQGGQTPRRDRR